MGAQKRLNDAKAKAAKLEQWFNEAQGKAQEAYFADEDKGNATFRQWVPQNVGKPKYIPTLALY